MNFRNAILTVVLLLITACNNGAKQYAWDLPKHIPRPVVPDNNPMNAAKVELGRWLFYDTRLSKTGAVSCGTCHQQALSFTDGRNRSIGATGDVHPRSAMSLLNSAYASRLTWANPLLDRLEDQALTPLFGDQPIEMGLTSKPDVIGQLLATDGRYKALTESAFPDVDEPHSVLSGVRAIASFVRTLVSFDSAYDRYLAGESSAMTPSAIRGMDLFFSEKLECFHCHGGFNFSDSSTHDNATVEAVGFHNTGLYNLKGSGAYPPANTGLYDMTGDRRDMGRFRAPSLRNIAVTAPYMHDGSVETLGAVIDHYSRGGRRIETGEFIGDGKLNPFKSEFVDGFELQPEEKAALIAFLNALTDQSVLSKKAWSDPFAAENSP